MLTWSHRQELVLQRRERETEAPASLCRSSTPASSHVSTGPQEPGCCGGGHSLPLWWGLPSSLEPTISRWRHQKGENCDLQSMVSGALAGRWAMPALGEVCWDGLPRIPALQEVHVDRAGGNEKSSPKPVLTTTSTDFTRSAMALKARAPALDIEKLPSPCHPGRPGAPVIECGSCYLTPVAVWKVFCKVPSSPWAGIPIADSPASLVFVNEKHLI